MFRLLCHAWISWFSCWWPQCVTLKPYCNINCIISVLQGRYFTIFVVIYLSCTVFCVEWLICSLQFPIYLIGCTYIWSLIIKLLHSCVSSSKQYCLTWSIFFFPSQNVSLSSCTDFRIFFAVFFLVFCNSSSCKHIYRAFFSHLSSLILFTVFFLLFVYIIKLRFITYLSISEFLSWNHWWCISQHRVNYRSNITL